MPMVMVEPRVYEAGKGPVEPVMADLRKRYALTGLGLDCQWDSYTTKFVGDCVNYGIDEEGNPLVKAGGAPGTPAWTEAILGLSRVFGQAYLNEHQAKLYQTTPQGTTFYQQSGLAIPAQNVGLPGGTSLATGMGVALGSMPWIMIAAGVGVLVLVMSKR